MRAINRRILCLFALIGLLFASPTAVAQPANFQTAFRHSGFASVLRGDDLIVIGGLVGVEAGTRPVTANYKVDMRTGDAMSISTDVIFSNGNAAALLGDIAYVSGGMALVSQRLPSGAYSTGFSDAFAAYDIANDSWRRLPDMPTTALGHCSFANDGSVYVVGGQQERPMRPFRSPYTTATRILQFSIADNRWSWIEAPVGALAQYAACTRRGDEYFLMGGYRDGPASKEVWVWNFVTNTWSRGPDLPNAVSGARAITHGDAIYIAGGSVYHDVNGAATRVVDHRIWTLENGAQEWAVAGEISEGRAGHALVAWTDRIFLVGGMALDRPLDRPRPLGLWIERIN